MTLAGIMKWLPHVRAALTAAIASDVKEVYERPSDVPKFDDVYVFVEFDRFVAPLKVRMWAIGFAGRLSEGRYESNCVLAHAEFEPHGRWPHVAKEWQESYNAGAIVPMDDSVGMSLFLCDPRLPIARPDQFFVKTLMF